jgi:hypothetical protein
MSLPILLSVCHLFACRPASWSLFNLCFPFPKVLACQCASASVFNLYFPFTTVLACQSASGSVKVCFPVPYVLRAEIVMV